MVVSQPSHEHTISISFPFPFKSTLTGTLELMDDADDRTDTAGSGEAVHGTRTVVGRVDWATMGEGWRMAGDVPLLTVSMSTRAVNR